MTVIDTDPFAAEQQDGEAFFSGGNIAAKFPTVGYVVEGNVLGWRMLQQSDMDSRELLWLYNGKSTKETAIPEANGVRARITANPKNRVMQMVIDLELDEPTFKTWETNQYVEKDLDEDSGIRSLYVKGGMKRAVGIALMTSKSGHKVPEIGSRLRVVRGKSEKTKSGFAAYTFTADYTPAAQNPKYMPPTVEDTEDDPFA